MNRPIKTVIIDDNPDYLFTMETFLKRNGFEVFTAENGKKGVEIIIQEHPDIILLDVMMETLFSGFEVCKTIRENSELEHTPIIAISGMEEELRVQYDKQKDHEYFSPDEFVEKPVDRARLLTLIPKVMEKAEKRKRESKWSWKSKTT